MVSLGLRTSFLVKILTDFKTFYDKKMRLGSNLNLVFLLTLFLTSVACEKKGTAVTFENICQEDNQRKVEIKGFLYFSPTNYGVVNGSEFLQSHLLVEQKNGTGGFIEVLFKDEKKFMTNGEVKVIGKILKDDKSCVLEVEKIESNNN